MEKILDFDSFSVTEVHEFRHCTFKYISNHRLNIYFILRYHFILASSTSSSIQMTSHISAPSGWSPATGAAQAMFGLGRETGQLSGKCFLRTILKSMTSRLIEYQNCYWNWSTKSNKPECFSQGIVLVR